VTEPHDDLIEFLDASPSPYHAVAEAVGRLDRAGFVADDPDRGYRTDGGMLLAWRRGRAEGARLIGAHTDSPNLRIKPRPDGWSAGVHLVGTEPYGGLLLTSWLDLDLGWSGRVVVRGAGGPEVRLVRDDEATMVLPRLAIHLDRDVNERGLVVDRRSGLRALWGLGRAPVGGGSGFATRVAERAGVAVDDVLAWDLMCHDVRGAGRSGRDGELLSSGRLDNLVSCWGAVDALVHAASSAAGDGGEVPTLVVALFDHEEVGSESATGAAGPALGELVGELGIDRRSAALLSTDMAHAVHPNHPDRHDADHAVELGAGPALKVNVNQRYATDAVGAGLLRTVADAAGVGLQTYVHRVDLSCGSTIGPLAATRLGIRTVDLGLPMLGMHSARETMATADVAAGRALFRAWFDPS